MRLQLELDQFALHYVNKKSQTLKYGSGIQRTGELAPAIVDFLLALVGKVWSAPDTGYTRSGHFLNNNSQAGEITVRSLLDNLLQPKDCFLESSRQLAEHLYQQTPATASPGLLAIIRIMDSARNSPFITILKIRYSHENFVKILDNALTQLEVEDIDNLLINDIQKGAILPHPQRPDYDLKVIDKQATDDPARYFTEKFLGCATKKSDEHQVKLLLPELREYAESRKLPLALEKLPRLIGVLQQRDINITTKVISQAIQEQKLFGPVFDIIDFTAFLEHESTLGSVNIVNNHFMNRGKTGRNSRQLTYHFHDPDFRGIMISGPPQVMANILHVEGDTVTFRIETTKDGYEVRYE